MFLSRSIPNNSPGSILQRSVRTIAAVGLISRSFVSRGLTCPGSMRSILFSSKMSAPSICRRVVWPSSGKRISMSASMTETTPSSRHCGSASWMLNTSASGSASPVVSTTIRSGAIFSIISFTAASNSPSSEQQTQPPPSSAIRTFLPSITFVSIAISPNSFITMAILVGRVARMCRSKVVLPLPSGPVTRVIGVRSSIRYVRLTLNLTYRMQLRTPITLVTGPLGSGKTTLLRHILATRSTKIAIVMNEFGACAIDAKVIDGKNVRIAELGGGCVCCSLLGEFEAAVTEIIKKIAPDIILVETTGLAEPEALVFNIQEALPECRLDGVDAVIDAAILVRFPEMGDSTRLQIEGADILLLNKIYLVDETEIESLEKKLYEINSTAAIFHTERCQIDQELMFGIVIDTTEVNAIQII